MTVQRRLGELQKECEKLGIVVTSGAKRVGKREYVHALRDYYLQKNYGDKIPWHLQQIIKLETPMLCFRFKEMPEDWQEQVWDDVNWIAEDKINGCRMLIIYHKDEGIHFYSRNISVKDYLPVEYDNIWLPRFDPNKLTELGVTSFILDTEVLCPQTKVDTTISRLSSGGVITETNLAATTALLAMNKEDSLMIQKDNQIEFDFFSFHILELNGHDFQQTPWQQMIQVLNEFRLRVQQAGVNVRGVPLSLDNKAAFYKEIVAHGGEGVVLKDINSTYHPTESRYHKQWVKCKRTMTESMMEAGLGDTLDAFVSGFLPGNKDTAFAKLVGAYKVSVYLTKKDGTVVEHEIAHVPNITLEERKEITFLNTNGEPELKPEYYNRCMEIEGQWVSARVRRLVHPRMLRWRADKSPEQCTMEETTLEKLII